LAKTNRAAYQAEYYHSRREQRLADQRARYAATHVLKPRLTPTEKKTRKACRFAAWKKKRDPNIRRERDQERRFRFVDQERRMRPDDGDFDDVFLSLNTIYTRKTLVTPEFVFEAPSGRRWRERIGSIEKFAESVAAKMKLAEVLSPARGL
jgi:hypothetical protein